MTNKLVFPFKHNDVISFPDTETEYVDVGLGMGCSMPVAQTTYPNLLIVHKWGRGFRLELDGYSETFRKYPKANKKAYVSLSEYLKMFGDFSDLEYVTTKEELMITYAAEKN